jgi:hypothetical protein
LRWRRAEQNNAIGVVRRQMPRDERAHRTADDRKPRPSDHIGD